MIKHKEQTRPWLNIFEQIWHHCVLFPKVKQQSTFALLARRDQQDQASVVFTLLALSGSCRQSVQFLHLKTLLSQFSSSESAGYYLQVKGIKIVKGGWTVTWCRLLPWEEECQTDREHREQGRAGGGGGGGGGGPTALLRTARGRGGRWGQSWKQTSQIRAVKCFVRTPASWILVWSVSQSALTKLW